MKTKMGKESTESNPGEAVRGQRTPLGQAPHQIAAARLNLMFINTKCMKIHKGEMQTKLDFRGRRRTAVLATPGRAWRGGVQGDDGPQNGGGTATARALEL
jgi:hypothetical protein